VAVISKEPISVGLDLLIFPAEIFIEESVLLSFKGYFSISILANLIESEVILLAISVSGIDALTPEAFKEVSDLVAMLVAISAREPLQMLNEIVIRDQTSQLSKELDHLLVESSYTDQNNKEAE
jgi:hypothetical protein